MFKQVLSKLSESVVAGAGDYVKKKFSPQANRERAQEFLIENIRNLGARAPILSGVTGAIADNLASIAALDKLHDQQISEFIKSDRSAPMRESVQARLGPAASAKVVEREITKILTDIHRLINKTSEKSVKESEFYKKNEKFVADYQKSVLESLKKSNSANNYSTDKSVTSQSNNSSNTTTELSESVVKLDSIEKNTNKTVNLLEVIHGAAMPVGEKVAPTAAQPVTIKGAAQNIGGTFLNKLFDDKTIEKFAGAAQNIFNRTKSTDETTVVTQDTTLHTKVKNESLAREALLEKTKVTDEIESKKISVQEDIAEAVTATEKIEAAREKRELDKEDNPPELVVKITKDEVVSNKTTEVEANKTTDSKTILDTVEANKTTDSKTILDTVEANKPYAQTLKEALAKKNSKNNSVFEPTVRSKYNSSREILNSLRGKNDKDTKDEKQQIETEDEKESDIEESKIEGKQTSILEKILEEIKKLNTKEKTPGSPGVVSKEKDNRPLLQKAMDKLSDKATDYAARKLPGAARTTGRVAGRIFGAAKKGVGTAINAAGRAASYIPTIAKGAGSLVGTAARAATPVLGSLASGAGSLIGSAATGLGGMASAAATGLGSLAGGSALTAGAGLAAAGAGGYALGKYAINPLIDKGISAATGKDNTLGGWIYDKMNPEADFDPKTPAGAANVEQIQPKIEYKSPEHQAAHEQLIKEETESMSSDNAMTDEYKKTYLDSIKNNPPRSKSLESIDNARAIAQTRALAKGKMYKSQVATKNSDGSTSYTQKASEKLTAEEMKQHDIGTDGPVNKTADKTAAISDSIAAKTTIETQKKAPAMNVNRLSDVKEKQQAAAQTKAAQPIVINNSTAAPATAPAQQNNVVAPSVRNQDSTFERVQMQDYWSRSK